MRVTVKRPEPPPVQVTLELSEVEAVALEALLAGYEWTEVRWTLAVRFFDGREDHSGLVINGMHTALADSLIASKVDRLK